MYIDIRMYRSICRHSHVDRNIEAKAISANISKLVCDLCHRIFAASAEQLILFQTHSGQWSAQNTLARVYCATEDMHTHTHTAKGFICQKYGKWATIWILALVKPDTPTAQLAVIHICINICMCTNQLRLQKYTHVHTHKHM